MDARKLRVCVVGAGCPVSPRSRRSWRRATALLCGRKRELSARPDLEQRIAEDLAHEEMAFAQTRHIRTLVDFTEFLDSVAELVDCPPRLTDYLDDPPLLYKLICGSSVAATYRLRGPGADGETPSASRWSPSRSRAASRNRRSRRSTRSSSSSSHRTLSSLDPPHPGAPLPWRRVAEPHPDLVEHRPPTMGTLRSRLTPLRPNTSGAIAWPALSEGCRPSLARRESLEPRDSCQSRR
jgi:hypothetical protein